VYDEAFRRTEFIEGRATNDPDDHGGVTGTGGLSLRYLRSLGQLADLDHDGDVDEADLALVTDENRKEFYYTSFWLGANCNRITSRWLQMKLYDTAVNAGPKAAQKILQLAMNDMFTDQLVVDGKIGNATASKINSGEGFDYMILQNYRHAQGQFYFDIVRGDPTQQKYALGWARRAYT
jgi:lysozyme family protein